MKWRVYSENPSLRDIVKEINARIEANDRYENHANVYNLLVDEYPAYESDIKIEISTGNYDE